MAEEQANGSLPPPSETVHLPGPTYLPVLVAAFTTIALVGIVLNWIVFGIADGGRALLHRPLGPRRPQGHRRPAARALGRS